ncbi:hypothetical protein E2562_024490 [Oryza meyeriana var. granulata]|uniref:DUF1618 domain-containing protein n=1 Tax=Oryza meyeriana var. granulata TaxID=110450 RepID=A0A6G1BNS8_9ORYZ|nr:hypothetical protein E2562_024490 [Oryza meyeriana var. granulata]
MSAARSFPNWVMLDRFVFRRDDDKTFPNNEKATIRASGLTTREKPFNIAFCLAEPPGISRLYVQLPGFPGPRKIEPLSIVATHRHLILFCLTSPIDENPRIIDVQDLFIYDTSAISSSQPQFKVLPPCTELYNDGPRICRPPQNTTKCRLLMILSMGLLCRGEEEFAVVELNLYRFSAVKVQAQLCVLRSHTSTGPRGIHRSWHTMQLPINIHGNPRDM